MSDLKDRLNPSQLAAVSTINGPVLVIAGAGSGKTRAIEYRVLNLIQNGVKPGSILLLTFTRKASHEMISRASRHDPRCRLVEGGTFHSFALKTLKRYARVLGLSNNFSILDEADSEDAIHRCGTRLGFIEKGSHFPKKDTLRAIISMSVNKARSVTETLEKEYPHFLPLASNIDRLKNAYSAYKIEKSYLDYDDLLVYLKLLLGIEEVREKLSRKYEYVMVDEYQDTNALQGAIAYLLAARRRNIMVVGDDAQSIYAFRGSSHKNIMEFPKGFPECKIIKLEENYRSTQVILDVANAILENMNSKYSKCLISMREDAGEKPQLNFFKNIYDEAGWIVERIKELRDEGVGLEDQAVLFRAAYVSIPLQAELGKNGIPYQVFGGLKFYETAHVKDLLCHLKVISNPRDEIAWHRVLMLIEGIGAKTAERLSDEILARPAMAHVAGKVLQSKERPARCVKALARLRLFLEKSRKSRDLDPGALYELALDYYSPIMREKFDDWHVRINDLEALRQIASRYDSVDDLLADFAIEPPERGVWQVTAEPKDSKPPLTLSTIHSAKGLEWDSVFLTGLVEGVLPSSFALNSEEEIEEESRLLYVGITRAKNRLYLSLNHEGLRGGITQFNKISRFIDAPNVFAALDKRTGPEDGTDDINLDEDDGIEPVYDKNLLLREITGGGDRPAER